MLNISITKTTCPKEKPDSATLGFGKKFTVHAQGFLARAFCHEYDHLDGIIYVDKALNLQED